MKRLMALMVAGALAVPVPAQQTDPTLTGAVAAQTEMLKKVFKDREKTQQKIIAAETSVAAAMERMHKVEDQMLEYLTNVQGAMQNIYQIKRAAELTTVEIPRNMDLVRKAIPGHLKGTAITVIVSEELTDAATQMASLYPFMKQLVTSGTYNVTNTDGKTEKHKVNLLSSAERYYVANEVVSRLEAINTDLWLLAWQIRTMSWGNLWFGLDPEGWATVMSGKAIIEGLIWEWNYL
jgi:membrane-associated HD superfamily phosphohydrolase